MHQCERHAREVVVNVDELVDEDNANSRGQVESNTQAHSSLHLYLQFYNVVKIMTRLLNSFM